jgi:uncharacterized protein
VQKNFSPSWWCSGPHAQTIAARFLRAAQKISYQRTRLELPDGDFLDLDFCEENSSSPLVIILHGLEGSSDAPYVRSLVQKVKNAGWNSLAVNFRSCSGEPNRLKESYHSGQTRDLQSVMEYVGARYKAIFLAGYSIGGNIILKWLGEEGEAAAEKGIKAAVAVSVPYDLEKAVEVMDRGFNKRIYTANLLWSLKKKSRLKSKKFPAAFRLKEIFACRTFRGFDSLVTAPVHGFKDAEDYWRSSGARHFLQKVRIPSLLIHAADDPFFPEPLLPMDEIKKSSQLKLLLTRKGGHVGFMAGRAPWRQESWLEDEILHYFNQIN